MCNKEESIKVERFEQLWEVSKNTVVECICSMCNQLHRVKAESKRKRTKDNFLLCRTCLTKKTNMQKYGVENVGQLEKTRNNIKNRDKEWYDKREIKRRKTNLIKYGTEFPQRLDEVKKRQRQTVLNKYGVDNIFKKKDYIKYCTLKKIGRENYFAGKEGKKLAEEAMFKKHGVRKAFEKEEFKQKYKETNLKRYGTDNFARTEAHTIKMQNTNLEKFGNVHAPSYTYKFDNISFDSSWELSFWIYCKDNNISIEREPFSLPYTYNNKNYYYVPDFKINNSILIEVKGNYFLDKKENLKSVFDGQESEKIEAKNRCMKNNNVRIITSPEINKYLNYIKENYGKDYLKRFKK